MDKRILFVLVLSSLASYIQAQAVSPSSCLAGQYFASNSCNSCKPGDYQPNAGQSSCISCNTQPQCSGVQCSTTGQATILGSECHAVCQLGRYYNLNSGICTECDFDTYNPSTTSNAGTLVTACNLCVAPTPRTVTKGASNSTQCYPDCQLGYDRSASTLACTICSIGQFRSGSERACTQCPAGQTTLNQGSTSSTACVVLCEAGQYLSGATCVDCAQGFYQQTRGTQTACTSCGTNSWTRNTGATLASACLPLCGRGQFLSGNTCINCGKGNFNDIDGRVSKTIIEQCQSCGSGRTTRQEGADSFNDCVPECTPGQFVTASGTCQDCEKGKFQSNFEQPVCLGCGQFKTTLFTKSTASTDCVDQCTPGKFRNSGNNCESCSLGEYQPGYEHGSCTSCGFGFTTRVTGATNSGQCVQVCGPGTYVVGTSCPQCQKGFYSDTNEAFTCTQCPGGKTTSGTGASSVAQCFLECNPGSYNVGDTCVLCQKGYWSNDVVASQCNYCGAGFTTSGTGSTSQNDCFELCLAGEYLVNKVCEPCPKGMWQNQPESSMCNRCNDGWTTAGTGSTSVSQCYRFCNRGYSLSGVTCVQCQVGQYQDQEGQLTCKNCPAGQTTLSRGAGSATECRVKCQPGYYRSGTACTPCGTGRYSTTEEASTCQNCPGGTSTGNVITADSQDDCFGNCNAGEYAVLLSCFPCEKGKYQPNSGQKDCLSCPSSYTTDNTGSRSSTDCKFTCEAGKQRVGTSGQVCEECPRGTWKNTDGLLDCADCPVGFTTANTGTILQADCSVKFCPTGQYATGSTCIQCEVNYYQDLQGQSSCKPCPPSHTTTGTGNDNINDCVFTCPAGYTPSGTNQCSMCEYGYYKSTEGPDSCTKCPAGYTTGTKAAVAVIYCNIKVCPKGSFRNKDTNECEICPQGTYQDNEGMETCTSCPAGFTTEQEANDINGATSASDCFSTNECVTGRDECHTNAHCTNLINGYRCVCRPGYVGDGVNFCEHLCDRAEMYCLNGGTCSKTSSGARCECTEDYIGSRCAEKFTEDEVDWRLILGATLGALGFLLVLGLVFLLCYWCCRPTGADQVTVIKQAAPPSMVVTQPSQKVVRRIVETPIIQAPPTQPAIQYGAQPTIQYGAQPAIQYGAQSYTVESPAVLSQAPTTYRTQVNPDFYSTNDYFSNIQ